jgi:hypothetical protein
MTSWCARATSLSPLAWLNVSLMSWPNVYPAPPGGGVGGVKGMGGGEVGRGGRWKRGAHRHKQGAHRSSGSLHSRSHMGPSCGTSCSPRPGWEGGGDVESPHEEQPPPFPTTPLPMAARRSRARAWSSVRSRLHSVRCCFRRLLRLALAKAATSAQQVQSLAGGASGSGSRPLGDFCCVISNNATLHCGAYLRASW